MRLLRSLQTIASTQPWRSALVGACVCGALGLAYWAIAPRKYRAEAIIAPTVRSTLPKVSGTLGGLAGQLGLATDADPTNTPEFYGLLASTESIRREVLFDSLPLKSGARQRVPVWRALGVAPCDSTCILRIGLERLHSAVDVVVDRQTGTFDISAVVRDPNDAAAIVTEYVNAMARFNRTVRQSQARASREFLEGRVNAVTGDLHSVEDDLQRFYEQNVRWQTSPRLMLQEGRLRRAIDAQTELLATMVRQLEAARLDEVNSTPLLSVIDPATPPVRKYSPRGLTILIASLVAGTFLGLVVGIARINAAE